MVLGAGVIGATTAYVLAREGHAVTLVDRRDGPGLEASYANGGQIAASHAEPWAGPSTPLKLLAWLGRDDAPLQLRWARWDPAFWAWGLRFLANCPPARQARNLDRLVRLALDSRQRLVELRADLDLRYDARTEGILHIYRQRRSLEQARRAGAVMSAAGLDRHAISIEEAVAREPALAHVAPTLAGAFYSPGDESGDAHAFTRAMAEHARRLGARLMYGTAVTGLERGRGRARDRVAAVRTDRGRLEGDAVVLALGSLSPRLTRPLGLRLPVYPAKGYSITLDTRGYDGAPTVSVTDDEQKMVFSRLGDRLRCAGTAALEGWGTTLNPARVALTLRNARALFPRGGNYDDPDPWCGLRPATPGSVPLLGRAPGFDNLLLNTGHGTLGWTLACGSAQVTADVLAGREPAVPIGD
nr:D-amino acid dehydrogenase [Roseospira visakhapatnamensis]